MNNKKLYATVTCDTEFLPPWNEGSWEDMSTWTFEQGVPVLAEILDKFGAKGTFYCQATSAKRFPQVIKELVSNGHLIGSHGYNHENYGGKPVKVMTEAKPILLETLEMKHSLLKKSIDILNDTAGYEPKTFVAPFDNIDNQLLFLLDDLGFTVDSSFHNYSLNLSSFPFYPIKDRKIVEIPLTVLPTKVNRYKNVLEAYTFDYTEADMLLTDYIIKEQEKNPFVVIFITSHPYEFLPVEKPHPDEVLIVGEKKCHALTSLLENLRNRGFEFRTPLDICEVFKQNL